MSKRTIILHPGFPKCATSAIQRAFVLKDHELGRAMGVTTLGRQLMPNAGYPDVSKLMYAPDDCLKDLQGNVYESGMYFLSNEALSGNMNFIVEIGKVFDIDRVVFTIRLPLLQAVSNYCYSGWTANPPDMLLDSPAAGAFSAAERLEKKLKQFAADIADVRLCPVEGEEGTLNARFCQTCFDHAPAILSSAHYSAKKASNASISLAFADAMHLALMQSGAGPLTADQKKAVVKMAQSKFHASGTEKLLPATFRESAWKSISAELETYRNMLLDHGVDPSQVDISVSIAQRGCDEFLQQRRCAPGDVLAMNELANQTLRDSGLIDLS